MYKRLITRSLGLTISFIGLYYLLLLNEDSRFLFRREFPSIEVEFWVKTFLISVFILSLTFVTLFELSFRGKVKSTHKRGRDLITFREAERRAARLIKKNDSGIQFGFLRLPSSIATSHFAFIGATGSGKTISIRLLMQSILTKIGVVNDQRAIIFDAKQEMLPLLSGMGLNCPIITISPFDKRCYGWDMAKDITSPATANQVASILAPVPKNASQPHFHLAVQDLLSGIMTSFILHSPGVWTFEDVVIAMGDKDRMYAILSRSIHTAGRLAHFENEDTFNNIQGTIRTIMLGFEVVAARWGRAEKKISLSEWLKSDSVLILGNDEALRSALDPINRVIFKRLSELSLAQEPSETRRTWIILDELREAGKLDGLTSLLNKGRSNGVSVIIGFQDIEGLRSLYTKEVAHEILSQCANKAILRIDSSETAEWAEKLFGEKELLEEKHGVSRDGSPMPFSYGKQSKSLSYDIAKRPVVVQSEFLDLSPTTKVNGLSGFYLVPAVGAYSGRVGGAWIDKNLSSKDESTKGVIPSDESEQFLRYWTEDDYLRLGLTEISGEQDIIEESGIHSITKKEIDKPIRDF